MDEIIRMLNNNIGNKLTLELANGMLAVIEKHIKKEEEDKTGGVE